MGSPTKVWVELVPAGDAFVIRAPYVAAFIEALKLHVPPGERSWDGVRKVWIVDRTHWKAIKGLIQEHYGGALQYGPAAEAAFIENMADEALQEDPSAFDYTVLGIRVDAPLCVVHAAWRAIDDAIAGVLPPWNDGLRGDLTEGLPPGRAAYQAYHRICRLRGVTPLLAVVDQKQQP